MLENHTAYESSLEFFHTHTIRMAFMHFLLAAILVLLAEATFDKQPGLYQGDIILKKTRNGILPGLRWTDGIIPYEFDTRSFKEWNQNKENIFLNATKEIQDHTCLKFRRRTNEQNYLVIRHSQGCSSAVGMNLYDQGVNLNEYGCWYHKVIVHELMHAIGLWHEQSRYDRDQYIKIHLQNVEDWAKYNFDQKFPNETDTYGIPYNYRSVMHYDKTSFTKNGRITMETMDPKFQHTIGTVQHGAESDYEKIRRIYGCKGNFPRMPEADILPAPPCQDYEYGWCGQRLHECTTVSTVWAYCPRSCGLCTSDGKPTIATSAPTTAPPTGGCKDEALTRDCLARQEACGNENMKYWCPKTCGYC